MHKYYRANNKDLANLNNSQLLQHFEIYGINEGRQSSLFFDAGYYKANNPDLLGLKGIKLLEHFDSYGAFEGRLAVRDYAGNTFNNARLLTANSKNSSIVIEHIGTDDPVDYYRFVLNEYEYRTVQTNIYSYSRSVIEEVLDSNGRVISSKNTANTKDSPKYYSASQSLPLSPGTYYIRIQPQAGNTDYLLQLSSYISQSDAGVTTAAIDFGRTFILNAIN